MSLFEAAAAAARIAAASGALGGLEWLDARSGGTLRTLTYHRIVDPADPGVYPGVASATPRGFEHQMLCLARRCRPVSLDEVLASRRSGLPLPPRAALVTFDDAYVDFAECAWPVLRRLGIPVVLFVPTAHPGEPERRFWWDRVHRAIAATRHRGPLVSRAGTLLLDSPEARLRSRQRVFAYVKQTEHETAMAAVDELCAALEVAEGSGEVLSWGALRDLARQGVALCPHTRTHVLLDRVSPARARAEIEGSFRDLRRELGPVPPVFAYPDGRVSAAALEVLRDSGVELAFTTARGVDDPRSAQPLLLRRINVSRRATEPLLRAQLLRWFPGEEGQVRPSGRSGPPGASEIARSAA